jgi:5'-nucleotidase
MRFHYDLSRLKFDAVTQIELGDIARGYRTIDIADTSTNL